LNRFCAKLILAAEIECGAFMFAAKHLFGEEMTLRAGGLWVEALEEDSSFQCQHTSLRLITIIAACKLADLMGAPIPKDVCWCRTVQSRYFRFVSQPCCYRLNARQQHLSPDDE
jgi:hypothetical protein